MRITSTFIEFSGDITTPSAAAAIFRPADNTLAFSTGNNERLRITSAGHVNIGGASPSSTALTVKMDTNKHIGFSPLQSEVGNVPALVAFQDNGSLADIGFRGTTFRVATGSAERVRINSAGLVGIATAVPSYRLDIGDGATDPANGYQLRVNAAGDYIFALQRQSNASFSIRNNSTGIVHLNTQNSKILSLGVNSGNASGSISDDVRIDSNGHLTIQDGNLVVANGHGIDFSATGNGSGTMSSELLDDYEEGTFTASWGDSSSSYSSPSPTYTVQSGHYTKVGNTVYFDLYLATNAWNSSGGTMWIHGMPYAARNSGQYQQAISGNFCVHGVDDTNTINTLTGQIQPGASLIQLYYQTSSSGNNYNSFGTGSVAENNPVAIRFNGFYFIS